MSASTFARPFADVTDAELCRMAAEYAREHATADNATRRECALADLALVDAEWRMRKGGAS